MRNIFNTVTGLLLALFVGTVLFGVFHGVHVVDQHTTDVVERTCKVQNATPILHTVRRHRWRTYVVVSDCGESDITQQQFDQLAVGHTYRFTYTHHKLTGANHITDIVPMD